VPFRPVDKTGPRFLLQAAQGLYDSVPLAVLRYRSDAMQELLDRLLSEHSFDRVVCDFLCAAINFRSLRGVALFQHNVETMIWRRLAANTDGALQRAYLRLQAARMCRYEREKCREASQVIAVSDADAERMREMFGLRHVLSVPTGVDTGYFERLAHAEFKAHLVFLGSMDWMPNIDGVEWFVRDVLPLIRRSRPDCTLAIAGRNPSRSILDLAARDPLLIVTGALADVRPWLWGAQVSIVPLRAGGGTRLKIYESMAAGVPVVSTSIGAEGLTVHPPRDIRIADTAEEFAAQCVRLLDSSAEREAISAAALALVRDRFSWEHASRQFEDALAGARAVS
jgi:glycosyltransferase involved in cell wall biosynthesis